MKKGLPIILLLIGLVLLVVGLFLIGGSASNNGDSNDKKDKKEEKEVVLHYEFQDEGIKKYEFELKQKAKVMNCNITEYGGEYVESGGMKRTYSIELTDAEVNKILKIWDNKSTEAATVLEQYCLDIQLYIYRYDDLLEKPFSREEYDKIDTNSDESIVYRELANYTIDKIINK